MDNIKKVILSYSGGLDTSIMIKWLLDNYGCEVIAVAANVGQAEELDGIEEKAKKSGASKIYVLDLVDDFVENYAFEALKAEAKYEGEYLLGTALARPAISKALVDIAHKENADAIVHGCTGKGNDQVRFELGIRAFDPHIKIIAPWRIWKITSREEELEYAAKNNIPLLKSGDNSYSEDRNLWHISHEGLELENPETEPNFENMLTLCKTLENADNTPEYLSIDFEKGLPVAINSKKMKASQILDTLNKIGGKHGIGIDDILENRLVGIKVRGVYENPGASILYKAHNYLESLVLDKSTRYHKIDISNKLAELIYNGHWFSTVRYALSAFIDVTQEKVCGTVKLKLYKGNIINMGVISKYSLYKEEYATFGKDGVYSQSDSQGFVNLYALSTKIKTMSLKG